MTHDGFSITYPENPILVTKLPKQQVPGWILLKGTPARITISG